MVTGQSCGHAHLQLLDERVHGDAGGPDAGAEGDVAGLILLRVDHRHQVAAH